MDFDALLTRFFGTDDLGSLAPEQLVAGLERARLQYGLERDEERRFGLWCLLYMLGAAPDVEEAFTDEDDRAAARDFMDEVDAEMDDDEE